MNASNRGKKLAISQEEQLGLLSGIVGDFIRYWGFRRIHGQLWTQIYLSKIPLSGVKLMNLLDVSKALVSKGLQELLDHNLISCEFSNGRTKVYTANPDVFGVIQTVLKTRECELIQSAQRRFRELEKTSLDPDLKASTVANVRLAQLRKMMDAAQVVLQMMTTCSESELMECVQGIEQALS